MAQTHWKTNFSYKYTGAYELQPGETKILTIQKIGREEVMNTTGQKEMCTVAYFKESSKPMVLNKTNCKTIEKLYGPYLEDWSGKRIIIESRKVKAFGDEVDALRVKKCIPEPEQKENHDSAKSRLTNCKTIDELKTVFTSLSPKEQAATLQLKDDMKSKLSGGSK